MGQVTKELYFDSWHGQETFFYSKASRQAMGPTQTLCNGHLCCFPKKYSSWNVKFSTYFHLVPAMRISGAITPLPPYALMVCTETKVRLPAIFIVHTSLQAVIQITCQKPGFILMGCMKKAAYLNCECHNAIFLSTDLIFEYSHFAIVSSSQHFRLHKPLLQFVHFASTL